MGAHILCYCMLGLRMLLFDFTGLIFVLSLRKDLELQSVETEKGYVDFWSWTTFIVRWPWTSGRQRVECGGLDENVPHRLKYALVLKLVMLFGDVQEVFPCWRKCITRGRLWDFIASLYIIFFSLCFMLKIEDVFLQPPAHAAMATACCHASPP